MIEVIVHYEGTKSSISFDALPTYSTLRRAITSDITNGDTTFTIIGATQRGTPLAITDQTSFIRALGPRSSIVLTVRSQNLQQPQSLLTAPTTTTSATITTATAGGGSSTALRSVPLPSQLQQQQQQTPAFRDPQQSPPRRGAVPAGAVSAAIRGSNNNRDPMGAVQQVVDVAGDTRCCVYVPVPFPMVWAGERQTGNIRIHDYASGAVRTVLRYEDGSTIAATNSALKPARSVGNGLSGPHSGCLCIAFVPGFASSVGNNNADCVWAGFNSKEIRVYSAGAFLNAVGGGAMMTMTTTTSPISDHKRMLRGILCEHTAAVTAIEAGPSSSTGQRSPFCFSASLDFSVLQWNVDSMSVSRVFARHRNAVRSLASCFYPSTSADAAASSSGPFAPAASGAVLFSGGDDRSLVAWDAQSGAVVAEGVHIHSGGIHALAVDGECRVWSGCEDGSVKVWELQKTLDPETNNGLRFRFQCVASFREHVASVAFIRCFSARTVSSSHDGTICVYDTAALEPIGSMPHPHDAPAVCVALASFSTVFKFWTGSSDRKFCRWSLDDPSGGRLLLQQQPQGNVVVVAAPAAQDDAISLLRFTLDRTTEKTLIVAEESKNRAEMMHLFERRLRQKYFVLQTDALVIFSHAALAAHSEQCKTTLDTHVALCLESRSALERTHSALSVAQAELGTVLRQRDNQGRSATSEMHGASQNILGLNRRIQELEGALSFARSEAARVTADSRERVDREAQLQQAYDAAIARQKVLEQEASSAHDARHREIEGRERGLMLRDEQWRQQEFALQEQISNLKAQVEERDSALRTLRLQLENQRALAASKEAELTNLVKTATDGGLSGAVAANQQREIWAERARSLEEKLDKALTENNALTGHYTTETTALRTRLTQCEDENRSLRSNADADKRAAATKIAELESAVAQLTRTGDDARTRWQAEAETLCRDLSLTQDTLTRADGYAVKVERDAALERAALKQLESQTAQLTADNTRLREALLVEKASAHAQSTAQDNTITTLRREVVDAKQTAAAEQQARQAMEQRLASIERSYEDLKRTVDDGAAAVSTAYEQDTSALARKYSELEVAATACASQLQDDIASLQSQLQAAQRLNAAAEANATAKAAEASALANDLREVRSELANALSTHRREIDSLRMDVADMTHAAATAAGRHEQEKAHSEVQMAELKVRLRDAVDARRKLETDLAKALGDAAAASTRATVTAEAEGLLQKERAQLVRDLTELQTAVTAAETRVALQSKRLQESEAAVAAAHDEKSRLLAAKQTLVEQQTAELDGTRAALARSEQAGRDLQAQLQEVQTAARNREKALVTGHEEALGQLKRAARAAEEERHTAMVQTGTIAERLRAAETEAQQSGEALRAAQEQLRQTRIVMSAQEQELASALAQERQRAAALGQEKEALEQTAREWRDIAAKVKSDAEAQLSAALAAHNKTRAATLTAAESRVAQLEAAVIKSAEVEQVMQERENVFRQDAQRAHEQLALVQREVERLRDDARQANAAAQRHKGDADDLRQELARQKTSNNNNSNNNNAAELAVRRLEVENGDLRARVQTLLRSGGADIAPVAPQTATSTSAARLRQLEDENDVLHGRVASLDAERNAAWKELQQLLEDHRTLHRQFTELKNSNNNSGRQLQQQQPSSEIALLRQQQQHYYYQGSVSRRSLAPGDLPGGAVTRGSALAAHYSDLLAGIRDALALVQRAAGGRIDAAGTDHLRKWLVGAAAQGDTVVASLFTEDERRSLPR